MNRIPCGQCEKYWAIQKGLRGGATTPLTRGHCLARSLYPKNKPGNPVYPPGAKVVELPNNVAKLVVVHENQIVTTCQDVVPKGGTK